MERPAAIELVRKLRRLGQGDSLEAQSARAQAAKHQSKHAITEDELAEATAEQDERESSGSSMRSAGKTGSEIGDAFLIDFVTRTRAQLCHEGRKRGRFADHPHAERILRARANAATKERP